MTSDESQITENINATDASKPEVAWTKEHEGIFVEWADKAMCYRWLHSRATAMFGTLNAWYTIPVIVISTLTGTANFAQSRIPESFQNYYVVIVGSFNILAGIITTVQQFLKVTQLNESHRVASIAWDKFYRNIKVELAKHPSERTPVTHLIKLCKEEFDRLMETSPLIPDKIIAEFRVSFKNDASFDAIVKPEICDSLESSNVKRNPWYTEENQAIAAVELQKVQTIKDNKQRKIGEDELAAVKDFQSIFFDLNNREPLDSEIVDNLKDTVDESRIKKIIEKLKVVGVCDMV